MKKLYAAILTAATFLAVAGCHAQVPATTHTVVLSGTDTCPTGSTCTYLWSRVTVTGTACPAATTGTYAALNKGSETSTVAYTDASAIGLSVCYVGQQDISGAYSVASNTAGPFVVPSNPTAPAVAGSQSTQTASIEKPSITHDEADMAVAQILHPDPNLKISGEVR